MIRDIIFLLLLLLLMPLINAEICPASNEIGLNIIPCEIITPANTNCSINATIIYLENQDINDTINITKKHLGNNTCNFSFSYGHIGNYLVTVTDLNGNDYTAIVTVNDFENRWFWFYSITLLSGTILFIIGRKKEDNILQIFSGFLFIAFGIVFINVGYPSLTNNLIRNSIIFIGIGLGSYISLNSGIQLIEK